MAYKFVKCKSKRSGLVYDDWRLVIDSHEVLNEWHFGVKMNIDKYVMQDALMASDPEYKIQIPATQHLLDAEMVTGKGALQIQADWSSRSFMAKFALIAQGMSIMINDAGGYMPLSDDIEITDTFMSKNIAKPKFTEKDIKVSKFRGGSHYYAKLGWLDVVVDGVQKWNTPEAAERAALEFLRTF